MTAARTASPTPLTGGGTQWDAVVPHRGGRSGTQWAAVVVHYEARPATPEQNDAYRAGLCITCRAGPHSAGRPRCNACHAAHVNQPPTEGLAP